MKNKFIFGCLVTVFTFFVSCYTPSPLYGTWTDNAGNKIAFMQDGTFTAKIVDSEGTPSLIEGLYSVIDNVIVFNVSTPSVYTRNTEWDIRGAILYIQWTSINTNNTVNLTLYHTAR